MKNHLKSESLLYYLCFDMIIAQLSSINVLIDNCKSFGLSSFVCNSPNKEIFFPVDWLYINSTLILEKNNVKKEFSN